MKRGSVPIQPTLEEPMSAGQAPGWDTSGAAHEAASTLDRAQGLMQLASNWLHWAPLGGYRLPAAEGRCWFAALRASSSLMRLSARMGSYAKPVQGDAWLRPSCTSVQSWSKPLWWGITSSDRGSTAAAGTSAGDVH